MSTDNHYTRFDISDYFFNRLSLEQEEKMQEHLLSCPACMQKLTILRNLQAAFDENNAEEETYDSPVTDVADVSAPPKRPAWPKRWIWVAASAAAILIVAFFLFSPGKEQGYPVLHPQDDPYLSTDTLKTDSVEVKDRE